MMCTEEDEMDLSIEEPQSTDSTDQNGPRHNDNQATKGPCLCCDDTGEGPMCKHPVFEGELCGSCKVMRSEEEEMDLSMEEPQPADNTDKNGSRHNLATKGPCLGCDDTGEGPMCTHPLFEGELCGSCKDSLLEGFYAVDQDGSALFCAVCGRPGTLYVCDSLECGKGYCQGCLEVFLSEPAQSKVQQTTRWMCFLCTPYNSDSHGSLVPRSNWQDEIVRFFFTVASHHPNCDVSYLCGNKRRRIRVLSLFDGISTGLVVLEQLGFDVEVYYASEIDTDAILTSTANHGPGVTHLGNVLQLAKRSKLQRLCPIDLVLGGPPCNDLSLANPKRKAFNGSAMFVLVFLRIVRLLEDLCQDTNHLFWLMENTSAMDVEMRKKISSIIQCEPVVWNAKDFSPQHRARFFWGNLPGLYSSSVYFTGQDDITLDMCLHQNFQRTALVPKLRTVTTQPNSLKVGNNNKQLPVIMDGKEDTIWICELECLFGFPEHYTDVANLPVSRRRQLLGRAWSVPVIKHILSPLKDLFVQQSRPSDIEGNN